MSEYKLMWILDLLSLNFVYGTVSLILDMLDWIKGGHLVFEEVCTLLRAILVLDYFYFSTFKGLL